MRIALLRSLFLVALIPFVAVAEPVARVQSIEGAGNLFVQRSAASKWFRAHKEMDASLGDHLKTDDKSLATLRFLLGGRANLDKGSEISIISSRDIDVVSQTIQLNKGNFWAKFDKQKAPIKIQTAGGVMGIRGTEFVVQVDELGNTVLSMLEGEVEVDPAVGSDYLAKPGSRVTFGPDTELDVLVEKLEQLRLRLEEDLPALSEIQHLVDQVEGFADLTQVQVAKMNDQLSKLDELSQRLNGESSTKQNRNAKAQDPGLQAQWPQLSWSKIGSPRFAVLILPIGSDDVLWLDETSENNYSYPSDAPPLSAGTYRYRIVPLDSRGNPQGKAFETMVQVAGTAQSTRTTSEISQNTGPSSDGGDNLIIADSGGTHSLEAQGRMIVVNGSDNTVIVSGLSPSVVVNGSSNMVVVKNADRIIVNGSKNTIKVDGGAPSYIDNGSGNLVLGLRSR